jgi:hypothetical protein
MYMLWKSVDSDTGVYHPVLLDPGNGIWGPQQQVTYTDGGNLATSQTPLQIGTSDGPAASVRNSELILIWQRVPGDHPLWFSRLTARTFSGQVNSPNLGSEAGPAIAHLNGRLVSAWRGIGNDHSIWVSPLG